MTPVAPNPREPSLPLRALGWCWWAICVLFPVIPIGIARVAHPPKMGESLPALFGVIPCWLGYRELRGLASRRRWRVALRQVRRSSDPGVVSWPHDGRDIAGALALFTLATIGAVASPRFSVISVLSIAALPICVYLTAALLFNRRRIAAEGTTLVCSSGPLRLPFNTARCEKFLDGKLSVVRADDSYRLAVTYQDGTEQTLAQIDRLERTLTVARATLDQFWSTA